MMTGDEGEKNGLVGHIPQLRVFRDVAGYCGVSISLLPRVSCNWNYSGPKVIAPE